jgi:hypothetical protein
MGVSLLSPLGLLVALAALVPLAALAAVERRGREVRAAVRLAEPPPRRRRELALALSAVAVLLALAAAQPVLARSRSTPARGDAEVLFAFDVSKSMAASVGRDGRSRLARAQSLAIRVHRRLGDVPSGLVALTDRTLPYLFPTANGSLFDAAVRDSVGIERPAPAAASGSRSGRASALGALIAVAQQGYYTPGVTHRVLVVLSDYESEPFTEAGVAAAFHRSPRVHTIFVRFWNARERIYIGGRRDPGYLPDRGSAEYAQVLAKATGGRAFDEQDVDGIVRAARSDLGTGTLERRRIERRRTPVAGWVALAALLPLGFVLRRRNL